ncbi:acetyltransferase [Bowmanella denitrificans]|uniref:acetyltransferase n=1 Tax=Bowmanella denitrificans TaxID=366582 RepID=UPI000C9B019F|nr:acetyltransferase [Bowmanella denitrificans]
MKKPLTIIGTGLFAEVAAAYFDKYSDYEVIAFACHRAYISEEQFAGRPLMAIESIADMLPPSQTDVFVAIGYNNMNKTRQRVYEEIDVLGYQFANFIHPNVEIWESTKLGKNVFIFEDNTIQPFTTIGNNTIFWSGNHLGHHSTVGSHCFISSHVVISGSCQLGNNLFIGVNATLRDSLKVADETLIGAGAIIMKDTAEKDVYVPQRTPPFHKKSDEVGF